MGAIIAEVQLGEICAGQHSVFLLRVLGEICKFWAGPPATAHRSYNTGYDYCYVAKADLY